MYNGRNKINGKIGGETGKKCIITKDFKYLDKYGLKIEQEFNSLSELAKYCNKSNKCITDWKNKKWIKII